MSSRRDFLKTLGVGALIPGAVIGTAKIRERTDDDFVTPDPALDDQVIMMPARTATIVDVTFLGDDPELELAWCNGIPNMVEFNCDIGTRFNPTLGRLGPPTVEYGMITKTARFVYPTPEEALAVWNLEDRTSNPFGGVVTEVTIERQL